jgi:hypothetical protein
MESQTCVCKIVGSKLFHSRFHQCTASTHPLTAGTRVITKQIKQLIAPKRELREVLTKLSTSVLLRLQLLEYDTVEFSKQV